MAFDYINEAFKKLELLEESMFDTSAEGISSLAQFIDDGDTEETVTVIDPTVESEEELEDSYVGKVIVNCNVCHSNIFEDKSDIVIEEDGTVNLETRCPYCGESEGFVIIGEIAPFNAETEEQPVEELTTEESEISIPEEEATEEASEEGMNEALGLGAGLALGGAAIGAGIAGGAALLKDDLNEEDPNENRPLRRSRATERVLEENKCEDTEDCKELETLEEDFKEVSITTEDQHLEMSSDENGKVTVVTEPIENTEPTTSEDMIVPVSDETEEEILANNDAVVDATEEDEFDFESDIDFDEVDESSFDELGEGYLHKVYENVQSFKTTNVSTTPTQLIVEGTIIFNNGVKKNTGFIFEACDVNSRGQVRFNGHNKHFSESVDAFSLVGRIDNKKLFVESLKYNYAVNESTVRGLVRRK